VIGRTPQETVKAWASSFQQALSCITLAQFHVDGYRPAERPHNGALNGGLVASLDANPSLGVVVILRYRILQESADAGARMVRIVAYRYALLDDAERDILAYEWHPEGTSWVTWPHLHVGSAMLRDGARLSSRMHLPTGQIGIEDVIRLAIVDFGVRPRRSDWLAVLARTDRSRAASPSQY
jgi:hypothetical protein